MRLMLPCLLLLSALAVAQDAPLFESDETLEITIEAPMRTLLRHTADRPVVDGKAHYADATGEMVSLAVQVSTRGKSRLDVCKFPPLALSVKKKAAAGTVFEGQKNLKLVTHCQSHDQFRQNLLLEYGIYEAFNVLTDVSFRTRFLEITYRDSEGRMKDIVEPAFLIEAIGDVASRNSLQRQKVPQVTIDQLQPRYAALTAMFHYMIGNTDWSVRLAPDGADCCHNGRVLSPPDTDDGWLVVPYDFDQTGLVNPSYAAPAEQLGIRSVRQRLWRGRCVHNEELEAVIALFNERRPELEAALAVPGIRDTKGITKYIDLFYKTINDPKRRARSIERRCLAS